MLDQFFKGEVPSIFETTIKREKGNAKAYASSTQTNSRDFRNEEEFLRSPRATLCYCGAFLTFGMAAAVIGPTLLELGCVTSRPVNSMGWIFFSQALSALFGSSISGIMADRYDCNIILVVCVACVAISLTVIPLCSQFQLMLSVFAFLGVNMGIIDTVANSVLIKIHGRKVAPRLQALHFFYGLGALMSPVISEPFLRDSCKGVHFKKNIFGWTLENSTLVEDLLEELIVHGGNFSQLNITGQQFTTSIKAHAPSFVQYAFWSVASLQIPVQAALFYLIFKQRQVRRNSPVMFIGRVVNIALTGRQTADTEGKELSQIFRPVETTPLKSSFGDLSAKVPLMTFLSALLLFFFDGLQGAYGGYLYTYAVKSEVHFTPSHGAYLTSLFWCLFAVGRFISIFVSMFVKPDKMLLANLTGCFVSMSIMFYCHPYPMSLWIGSSAFGLFMSSVFPSTLTLAEHCIDVTGSITSILIVSSASGEMLIPLLVGKEFTREGPLSFLVIGFIVCVFALINYLVLRSAAKSRITLTVSEVFHHVVGRACQCNSNYKDYFTTENCEYTQMVPCDAGADETTADCTVTKAQFMETIDEDTEDSAHDTTETAEIISLEADDIKR
ncbi:major facilitator superfamily domain-containing protein 4A [Nematostella vectensis]|uniref:major facilitator superfamily domain-containing protein 4A n=1 Tax=Nematostella vectensis TaxID=45351 RepID=UPI001390064C|nr:major facilitator superfamily domain-containing protein 4A [Nematostella vectensis]